MQKMIIGTFFRELIILKNGTHSDIGLQVPDTSFQFHGNVLCYGSFELVLDFAKLPKITYSAACQINQDLRTIFAVANPRPFLYTTDYGALSQGVSRLT
jgi:hypothetical protein